MSMNTKCKKAYVSPAILRQVDLAPKNALLAGSIETMTVTSTGQELGTYGSETDGFNHTWQ